MGMSVSPSKGARAEEEEELDRTSTGEETSVEVNDSAVKTETGGETLRDGAGVGAVFRPPPRLPIFSGDEKDATYGGWRYEVDCLKAEGLSEREVCSAIRRSLKGKAHSTLTNLAVDAPLSRILLKFDAKYGPSESDSTVLANFHSMRQRPREDAGSFAERLEAVMRQAITLGVATEGQSEMMLRRAFRNGLLQQTRMGTAHLFLNTAMAFDLLVQQVKQEERHLGLVGTAAEAHAVQTDYAHRSEISALAAMMERLANRLDKMEERQSHPQSGAGQRGATAGHHADISTASVGYQGQPRLPHSVDRGRTQPRHPRGGRGSGGGREAPRRRVVCFKCGQTGHLQIGCRNDDLNS